ncbi:coiled-coil domain-containing protein 78 [Melozone crissalis]|uniref:coiled-coil domain-containing protein 78 n=1 Tax=Melozone crissalis TaxID=40204 RepID=UPI0023DC720D|nr:coiled-coil domain-containing protein 78 [Melozone crissalis]
MDPGITAENESLEDRNQEGQQPGDPQEEMEELPGSSMDFPARMVLSEEEKLKISKDLVDLQIETNRMKERYETENFQLKTMMQELERQVQELEQGRDSLREERDSLREERDSLRERLQSLESSRQELGQEFIILKSNYLALGRELDKEVLRNEELTQELLSLAKESSLPPGLAHPSSPGLGRGRAAGQPHSAHRDKQPEDAAAPEHEQQELERNLPGNQDRIKAELEKLKKRQEEQQQKLEERVLALGQELQEAKGAAGAVRAEHSAALLSAQARLHEVEAENARLQLQLKELNEEYRCRLAQCLGDLANYMDSKPNSVPGTSKAPAGHAAMQRFVDSMLRDIQASYRRREEQLARAARGYRKRLKELAKKHENLLIAYGLQQEQIRALGSTAMDCGPAELHLTITDPELLANSSRELNRLRERKKSLKGASALAAPPEQQLDEEGWAEVRRKLREFTLNTQEELEQQRSQLLTRAVVAEEQVLELQGYIDQHLARYKQEILRLRKAEGSEVPPVPGASSASQEAEQPQPWEQPTAGKVCAPCSARHGSCSGWEWEQPEKPCGCFCSEFTGLKRDQTAAAGLCPAGILLLPEHPWDTGRDPRQLCTAGLQGQLPPPAGIFSLDETWTWSKGCSCLAPLTCETEPGWLRPGFVLGLDKGMSCSFTGRVGKGCPEQLWLPLDPWQCPRPGWAGLGAAWDSGRCPCPWHGEEQEQLQDPFKIPSNPAHSMILRLCGGKTPFSSVLEWKMEYYTDEQGQTDPARRWAGKDGRAKPGAAAAPTPGPSSSSKTKQKPQRNNQSKLYF